MHSKTVAALVIAMLILLGATGISSVLADESNTPGPPIGNSSRSIPGNATAAPLTLALENHTYYPNDTVRAFVYNVTDPLIDVIDPSGAVHDISAVRLNDSAFMGEYVLNRSIILANYTVIVTDNATGETVNDTFEVTMRHVMAMPVPDVIMMPDNGTNQSATAQPLYLYLNVSKNDYQPSEEVGITVMTNAGTPTVVVQDPVDNTVRPAISNINNDTYAGVYSLDKAVVLGNYTVFAYINENGAYNYTISYFNVTMSDSTAPKEGLNVEYAAYDPAQKAIVVRANVNASSDDVEGIVKNASAVKGLTIKGVHILSTGDDNEGSKKYSENDNKKVEVLIPVDNNSDSIARQLDLSVSVTKATISVTNINRTDLDISLNNKVDGYWYRISASIPEGYKVLKITRADGKEIKNDVEINNSTGEITKNDINWYVDNGILYFYDDPTNNYTVTLSPLANLDATYSPMSANPTIVTLYLHDNGTYYLNTSSSNSSNGYTDFNNSKSCTWTQSQALADNFTIQNNPNINLYLTSTVKGQTIIDVTLSYTDGTITTILGTTGYQFKYTSDSPVPVTINIPVADNTTVPAGGKLQITINSHNNKIATIWETTQYPSNISINSTSYIHVSNVTVYDALNNQVNGITAPSTIKVVANVTDPFGIQDISNVALTIYYENGTAAIGPLVMNLNNTTIPPSNAWALFESNIPINANQSNGNYTIIVTATSLNGVTDTNSTVLTIVPINVTASKSITLQSGNNFTITINVTNNNAYTVYGIHAYDFYAGDFNVGSFTQPRSTMPVNNGILQGNINVFGPFNLAPYQKITINYIAQGIGDYKLSNMTIVGVDPYV